MSGRSTLLCAAATAVGLFAWAEVARGAEPLVHVVSIDKLAFGPSPPGLHVNDIVEWDNADIFRHTATAPDGSFDVDLPPGAKGRAVLKRAGVFNYICRFHPGMKGRLDVAP